MSQGGGTRLRHPGGRTGLTLGSHAIDVTQSSAGGLDHRHGRLGSQRRGSTITTGSNDTVAVSVNGTAYNLTIAPSPAGGYSGERGC